MKIYVASLTDYNAGILHGRWIDLEGADRFTVEEQICQILAESPTAEREGTTAEEYAIHDTEDAPSGIGEPSLDEALDIQEAIDQLADRYGYREEAAEIVDAYIECFGYSFPLDASTIADAYYGEHDSEEAYAEQLAEETGMLDSIPESLRCYFDFEAFARDLFMTDMVMSANGHVFTNY